MEESKSKTSVNVIDLKLKYLKGIIDGWAQHPLYQFLQFSGEV